jgi:hypothetical protein
LEVRQKLIECDMKRQQLMQSRMEALQQTFQPAHLNSGSSRLSLEGNGEQAAHEMVVHSPFSGEAQVEEAAETIAVEEQ